MYASQGPYAKRPILAKFTVSDPVTGAVGVSGDEIPVSGRAKIHVSIEAADHEPHKAKVRLIRGGELLETFQGRTPMAISYEDAAQTVTGKTYYRVDVTGEIGQIVANPIFIARP